MTEFNLFLAGALFLPVSGMITNFFPEMPAFSSPSIYSKIRRQSLFLPPQGPCCSSRKGIRRVLGFGYYEPHKAAGPSVQSRSLEACREKLAKKR